VPVDVEKLMQDKRIVRGRLWFVVDDELLRADFNESDQLPIIPIDGGQCHRVSFADGTGDMGSGNGWLVFGKNSKGRIICQWTGDEFMPSPERYPNCQFCRAKLTDSALWHVAAEEMNQWR
jgi:hypothetical protein